MSINSNDRVCIATREYLYIKMKVSVYSDESVCILKWECLYTQMKVYVLLI